MRIDFHLLLLFSWVVLNAAQNRNGGNQQCDALTIQRPNNQNVCITNRAIDTAFQSAQGTRPLTVGAATDVLGLALVQTTSALARQFTLTRPEIENQLPTINTAPTAIRRFCPARLLQPRCTAQRFRTMDGSCNNLNNAHYGAAESPTTRLLPASYGDGLSTARVSASGAALPNVRQISTLAHQDTGKPDPSTSATLFLPAFGQTLGHDFNNVALTGADNCCQSAAANRPNPSCGTINYPANDPFFSRLRVTCADFPLSSSGVRAGCRLGSKNPFNSATTFIDASFVYGSDDATARNLRSRTNGLLRTDTAPRGPGLKELLPRNPANSLTLTGDFRSSQTPLLIVIHTLFLREHNRIARELFRINPQWNDERIYQETRRIIGAYVQHITYGEFLPIVLGQNLMGQYQLNLQRQGFANVYSGTLDPSLPIEFHAAAFRFGHSLIPPRLERWSVDHSRVVASEQLRNLFNRQLNDQGGVLDQYMSGFLNQMTHAVDGALTQELTNHVLQAAGSNFGDDLASRNIARGRDEGLPGYNAYRRLCGQSSARNWNDLANVFQAPKTLEAYRQLYSSVDDIDLWSAGISGRHAPGAKVGQVFGCIIGLTFQRLKRGDRFWYENGGQPSSFTQGQLDEIRKVSLSRMICDNSENIQTVQRNAFRAVNQNSNPRVPCASIPRINLELWRENQQQQTNTGRPAGTGGQIRPNRLGGRRSRTDYRMFTDFLNEYLN